METIVENNKKISAPTLDLELPIPISMQPSPPALRKVNDPHDEIEKRFGTWYKTKWWR